MTVRPQPNNRFEGEKSAEDEGFLTPPPLPHHQKAKDGEDKQNVEVKQTNVKEQPIKAYPTVSFKEFFAGLTDLLKENDLNEDKNNSSEAVVCLEERSRTLQGVAISLALQVPQSRDNIVRETQAVNSMIYNK
eukprot:CAMPEP_0170557028 /NCGR_PEP_ID=MMETSP0211-20121228/19147_1 /TAXON_ID=311385 /ORGANISM="Pseudokeronopsis sp., Strain OXSARD2" /LENGTH=132 /DNA_ID=CAMNT_0010867717 /DNA_START=47 /DNA_END=446 /DNA_ORIENTATION=-